MEGQRNDARIMRWVKCITGPGLISGQIIQLESLASVYM